jgi:uncharacterized protein
MKRMFWIGAVAVLVTAGVMPARAAQEVATFPSIDCRSDDGAAVDTICKSRHLRFMDQEIAERFTRVYGRASQREQGRLLREQRAFLAIRDGCGTDVGCLGDILHHRSDVIGAR